MAKTIVKELIISLLLCLAIILLLGILLYEYVPMTKTIPNAVSYTTPANVKQELAQSENIDENQIIMTYEVDLTDLNNYKRIQNYKPGKANPFSSFEATETNGTNPTTGNSSNGNGSNGNTTTGSDTTNANGNSNNGSEVQNNTTQENSNSSGGQFFQNKGTK